MSKIDDVYQEEQEQVIICPKCESVQTAMVRLRHGAQFWDYVHTCTQCGHVIMESEWEVADPFWLFGEWCKENGFADVAEGKPEDVDLQRLNQALAVYAGEPEVQHGPH